MKPRRKTSEAGRLASFQFAFGLAILTYVILAIAMPRVDLADAGEIPNVAASIDLGHGFSNPFPQPTGPSALVPPIYPYLLAGIEAVFGLFTGASYWVAVAFNVVVHAFCCVILYWVTRETFGRRAGAYAAIGLASFPLLSEPLVLAHVLGGYKGQGLFIPPNLIWNTHLSELSIVLLIWLTLRATHWALYGAAWGIAALINPGILALVPAFWTWRFWHEKRWRDLCMAAVVAGLCVMPWLVRNYVVFHRAVFIRDGFGIELKVGNQPGGGGLWSANVHPWRSASELSRVVQMGELEYARVAGEEARASIYSAPGEFARNSALRVRYYWLGTPPASHRLGALSFLKYLAPLAFSLLAFCGVILAFRDRNSKAILFVSVLMFYPLVYYVTHTFSGFAYQYPIQPEMLALATSVFTRDVRTDRSTIRQ